MPTLQELNSWNGCCGRTKPWLTLHRFLCDRRRYPELRKRSHYIAWISFESEGVRMQKQCQVMPRPVATTSLRGAPAVSLNGSADAISDPILLSTTRSSMLYARTIPSNRQRSHDGPPEGQRSVDWKQILIYATPDRQRPTAATGAAQPATAKTCFGFKHLYRLLVDSFDYLRYLWTRARATQKVK